ncbi:hypothetical protein GWI33_007380 [Rhynchophorus ferrugineus]|uniref:Uncharacterized protein n=1 Tax=Rhynchophorus ferrugineus TaxID=354439 RepID=A0A834ITK5_RHYFE|nr:hypothetical protein GWI33_007380 [Rhynchophorus ferrugineus]
MKFCYSSIIVGLLYLLSTFQVGVADSVSCPTNTYPQYILVRNLAELKLKYFEFNRNAKGYRGNALKFKQEYMTTIPPSTFVTNNSHYLVEIILRNKAIRSIQELAFVSLSCLRHLDLSHNEIIYIKRDQFVGLINLYSLNLSRNNIFALYHFTFKFLPNLEILDLSYNDITTIEEFAFNMLWKLKTLALNKNKMTRLNPRCFGHLSNLKHLDMSFNSFALIDFFKFSDLESLETLDLAGNEIAALSFYQLKTEFHRVESLNLSSNSFISNFDVRHLRKYFPNEQLLIDINNNYFYCHELEGVLKDLHMYKVKYARGRAYAATHHRERILCDSLNNTVKEDKLDYNELIKLFGTTTKKPKTSDYEYVLQTYRQDLIRHKRTVAALATIVSLAILYDILIAVDYLLDYKFLKTICIRRQYYAAPTEGDAPYSPLQH